MEAQQSVSLSGCIVHHLMTPEQVALQQHVPPPPGRSASPRRMEEEDTEQQRQQQQQQQQHSFAHKITATNNYDCRRDIHIPDDTKAPNTPKAGNKRPRSESSGMRKDTRSSMQTGTRARTRTSMQHDFVKPSWKEGFYFVPDTNTKANCHSYLHSYEKY